MTPAPTTRSPAETQRVETPDGTVTFTGVLLGRGTSRRDSHLDHRPGSFPRKGQRCSGCRWTETRILWSVDDETYVVSTVGRSIVPGEVDRSKVAWAKDPNDVVDTLLVPPPAHIGRDGPLELPPPNADALEEAARNDPRLSTAFDTWEKQ